MTISNGLTLPNTLVNGTTADAVPVMADFNTLLTALNRALLDTGGGSGMNAQNTQMHNLSDPSSAQDAATQNYVTTQLASYVLTSALAAYAPLASPTFTGVPVAPTATGGTNTTQLATTAFVAAASALFAPLASPALTGTPTAPTAAALTNTTQIATTAFVTALGISSVTSTSNANGQAIGFKIGGVQYYLQFAVGAAMSTETTEFVTFPVAFANANAFCVVGTDIISGGGAPGNDAMFQKRGAATTTGVTVNLGMWTGTTTANIPTVIAFGA